MKLVLDEIRSPHLEYSREVDRCRRRHSHGRLARRALVLRVLPKHTMTWTDAVALTCSRDIGIRNSLKWWSTLNGWKRTAGASVAAERFQHHDPRFLRLQGLPLAGEA